MDLPPAAEAHRKSLARITAGTLLGVRRTWAKLGTGDFDEAWATLSSDVLMLLMAGQLAAAREAQSYVPAVLAEQSLPDSAVAVADIRSVVGVAGSGMPLRALMESPIIRTRVHLAAGAPMEVAQAEGEKVLDGIVTTQVADAGRAVESVELAVRPQITGYVRCLALPSCSRCVILGGRFFRWSSGFKRHPKCDCFHIPTQHADSSALHPLATDPLEAIKAGKVTGLSAADTKAIVEDGADPNQVINAHRGMDTAQVYGQKLKVTTAGITKRGLAGQRLQNFGPASGTGRTGQRKRYQESKTPRLRPEAIYRVAGDDRNLAQSLLYRHGYLLAPPQ